MNYGVRWDIIYPETVNKTGDGGFASLVSGGTRVVGVSGIGSNGNEKMDYLNLAGRLGFAYQVFPNTVVRGGIGQVYDTVGYFGTLFGSILTHNLPVLRTKTLLPATQSENLPPPWRLLRFVRQLQPSRPTASFRSATTSTRSSAPNAFSCRSRSMERCRATAVWRQYDV